jgi:DNA-binding MarR family transcriptional regulator
LTIIVANNYTRFVAGKLQREIRQSRAIASLEEEATLNIIRTADGMLQSLTALLKPYRLSPTQYNLLRILRGAGETGLCAREIGNRLLARDPDITRLMDRLEERGAIARSRSKEDRRVVTHRLTRHGLALADSLDAPIAAMHRAGLGHLPATRLRQLIELLELVRTPE